MDRIINTLGKTSQRKLRDYKGVRSVVQLRRLYPQARTNEDAYELARREYNLVLTRRQQDRTKAIASARRNMSNQLSLLARNQDRELALDISKLHQNYGLKNLLNDLLVRINKYLPNQKLLLRVNGVQYALGMRNRQRLVDLVNQNLVIDETQTGSDANVVHQINVADTVYISVINNAHVRQNNHGGFFPYYNNTHFDFTKYAIYQNEDQYKQLNTDICLIHALREGGMSEEKIEQLKTFVKNATIPKSKLKDICELLHIQIVLRDRLNEKPAYYGKQHEETYKIGLIENHYFILDGTENTSYSIEHYEEIKNESRCNEIDKKRSNCNAYNRDSKRFINSFALIHALLENKDIVLRAIPFTDLTRTQYHKKYDEIITTLEYNESSLSEIKYEEPKKVETKTNVFFDFETRTVQNKHVPYLCCFIMDDDRKGSFIGEDCGLQMMKYLHSMRLKNIQMIAHNASYDYQFIIRHLTMQNELARGHKIITASGTFGDMKVTVKDSLHLISKPLREFGSMFKLQQEKEVMPYALYNTDKFDERIINVKDALEYLTVNEQSDFMRNLKKWNLIKENKFDMIEYSRIYCEIDCVVLRDGYNTFRQWLLKTELPNGEHANLDINNILTCAGFAHAYMMKAGCYNGVCELNGVPQSFIQKTVVGGRTMCANNKKREITGKRISDFDGVSLYPSAMARMDGFLKGKPKVLQTTDYEVIKTYDGYFVEVKINNIPIHRSFPLASEINKEGVRVFSNKIENNIFVDKIQMEDLIKFHGLTTNDFQIIRGYYFNDGFNQNVKIAIKHLFNTRLQKKREKNPCQEIYKLIMNSAYGKSIMKEVLSDTVIFNDKKSYEIYLSRNYDFIESVQQIDQCDKYKVKAIKTINEHCNIAQVGASVLSWSKRIMNEVMCLAENNGVEIFYQDTDSMHMYEEDIQKIADAYRQEYSRELIGESLGQFHTDFAMNKKCTDIHSRRMIMLGKKSYIDELVGIDEDGNEHVEYHIRMKGIPNSCINYTTEKMGLQNPYELYRKLLKGNSVNFDLTQGQAKAIFKFNNNYTVETITAFDRRVKF